MRTIKILFSVIFILIAIVIAAPFFLDPNDFKGEIESAVEKSTGRKLSLSGDLDLSIFPWLGVHTEKLSLGNRDGFNGSPFATIESAQIRVELLPLLRNEIKMDSLVLSGLNLTLERRKDGKDNWSDLFGNSKAKTKQDTPKLAALAIGGIVIDKANIRFKDGQTKQQLELTELSLRTGPLELGAPIDISLDTKLLAQQPAINGSLMLDTKVQANPFDGTYQLSNSRINIDLKGKSLPAGKLAAALEANIAANLITQKIKLSELRLVSKPLTVKGLVNLEKVFSKNPILTGKIDVAEFAPKELLKQMAIAIPKMADGNALNRASFKTDIDGTLSKIRFNNLKLILDDSLINGQVTLTNKTRKNLNYQFSLDRIDLDRYLPAPPKQANNFSIISVAIANESASPLFPVDLIRSFDMSGNIKAGQLIMNRLQIDNIDLNIKQQQGNLRIHPIKGDAYKGKYLGDIRIDARKQSGPLPIISVNEKLSNVDINPVIKIMTGKDALSGTGNVSAILDTRGQSITALKGALNGEIKIALSEGILKGVDVLNIIRETYAQYKNKNTRPIGDQQDTPFTKMNVSFQVRNGIMNSNDLNIQSALPLIRGKGSINLNNNTLDYVLKTSTNQQIVELVGLDKSLVGVPVRINLRGNLAKPSYSIDWLRIVGRVLEKTQKKKLLDSLFGTKKKSSKPNTPTIDSNTPATQKKPETREERKKRKKKEKEEKIKNLLKGLF